MNTTGTNGKTRGTDLTNNANYLHTEPLDLLQNTGHVQPLTNLYTTTTTAKPGLIYSKMSQVMKDITHVSKNQTNTAQGFKFRGIDQFINALYPALTKHGVFMVPSLDQETHELREVTRSNGKQGVDKHVHIQMSYTFYAEDGSYVIAGPIPSESVDSGDKATNKALSAALKYALIQTFSIPTEDMAEADLDSPEIGVDVKKISVEPKNTPEAPISPARKTFTPPTRQATLKTETTPSGTLTTKIEDGLNGATGTLTVSNTVVTQAQTAIATPNLPESGNNVAQTVVPKRAKGVFNPPKRESKQQVREE